MAIMGLDVGTTGSKAIVFDLDGTILASSYREYDLISPKQGWLELSPTDVIQAVKTVVSDVRSKSDATIQSIALSVLGEAAVPVDKNGQPLANAIIGFDSRGESQCRKFRKLIDPIELFNITGHSANSFHTLFKLMYIKERQPKLFAKIDKFLCFGDFISAQLGLVPTIDYSMAARTLMFDVNTLQWSEKILSLAGLDAAMLAKPAAPGTVIGEIGKNELNFPEGAILAAGLHDQPAGILGAGIEPGQSMLATGTVVCLGVLLNRQVDAKIMTANNLCRYPTFGNNFINIAWNFTGGSALKWFRDNLASDIVQQAQNTGNDPYDLIVSQIPNAPTNLILLPYFTTTGTPYLDAQVSGMLMGLTLKTDRFEIARAIMEGVAYELKVNQQLLSQADVEINLYKAIGGAAKSDIWMQIYADILNRPITVLRTTECAAWGVALLGAHSAGLLRDLPDVYARKIAKTGKQFEPRQEIATLYDKRMKIYAQLYKKNKSLLHQLSKL